jgi:hypothetical protein
MGRKKKTNNFGSSADERRNYTNNFAKLFLNKFVRINGRGNRLYKVHSVIVVHEPLSASYAELIDGPNTLLSGLTIINQTNRFGHRGGGNDDDYINTLNDKWKYTYVSMSNPRAKYLVLNVTFDEQGQLIATIFGRIGDQKPLVSHVLLSALKPAR